VKSAKVVFERHRRAAEPQGVRTDRRGLLQAAIDQRRPYFSSCITRCCGSVYRRARLKAFPSLILAVDPTSETGSIVLVGR